MLQKCLKLWLLQIIYHLCWFTLIYATVSQLFVWIKWYIFNRYSGKISLNSRAMKSRKCYKNITRNINYNVPRELCSLNTYRRCCLMFPKRFLVFAVEISRYGSNRFNFAFLDVRTQLQSELNINLWGYGNASFVFNNTDAARRHFWADFKQLEININRNSWFAK